MFSTVEFTHSSEQPVHAIFTRDFSRLREMVHFLVTGEALINLGFNIAARPHNSEILISLSSFSKTIVFKKVSYQTDLYLVVKLEVVTPVLRLVRSDTYWVDVWPEANELFPLSIYNCWWLLQQILNLRAMSFLLFLRALLNGPIFMRGI